MLAENAAEVAARLGPGPLLIELGSGSSRKVRILLDALDDQPARYLALDISREQLIQSTESLAEDYPNLDVHAICADYTQPLILPREALAGAGRRVAFFPGSTIGNFTPSEAEAFLRSTAAMVASGGALLIGVDLKKDPAILNAAYNDAEGLTAEFNRNLLRRLNRELGADFDLSAFRHCAFYNAREGRVEMHLESLRDQCVGVAGERIPFRRGETIHTENSHKFAISEFQALARRCGFRPSRVWTDRCRRFSLHWLDAQ